jgi:hypothetical protein
MGGLIIKLNLGLKRSIFADDVFSFFKFSKIQMRVSYQTTLSYKIVFHI